MIPHANNYYESHDDLIKIRLNVYEYKLKLQRSEQRVRAIGRCQFCDRKCDRKTTKLCTNFEILITRDYLVVVCPECFSDNIM